MNTPQTWFELGFEVEITGDGSPSLRLLQGPTPDREKGESMHHSGGAAEETQLIYSQVIHHCFEQIPSPHFISVGLGLGYVELSIARESMTIGSAEFTLESFELIPELREYFQQWLRDAALPADIQAVYDQVLKYVLKDSTVNAEKLKKLLCEKLENQSVILREALTEICEFQQKAQCLLFDAFSAKTSPALWDEAFLVEFFNKSMAQDSLVSTYASRTSLKRALQATGFLVEVREGFKGKRHSTLARRGLFTSALAGTSSHTQ